MKSLDGPGGQREFVFFPGTVELSSINGGEAIALPLSHERAARLLVGRKVPRHLRLVREGAVREKIFNYTTPRFLNSGYFSMLHENQFDRTPSQAARAKKENHFPMTLM